MSMQHMTRYAVGYVVDARNVNEEGKELAANGAYIKDVETSIGKQSLSVLQTDENWNDSDYIVGAIFDEDEQNIADQLCKDPTYIKSLKEIYEKYVGPVTENPTVTPITVLL